MVTQTVTGACGACVKFYSMWYKKKDWEHLKRDLMVGKVVEVRILEKGKKSRVVKKSRSHQSVHTLITFF